MPKLTNAELRALGDKMRLVEASLGVSADEKTEVGRDIGMRLMHEYGFTLAELEHLVPGLWLGYHMGHHTALHPRDPDPEGPASASFWAIGPHPDPASTVGIIAKAMAQGEFWIDHEPYPDPEHSGRLTWSITFESHKDRRNTQDTLALKAAPIGWENFE